MEKKVTIVNYGMGNLKSLQNALSYLNIAFEITSNPQFIEKAHFLILPGVGSFRAAMQNIAELNLKDAIKEAALGRNAHVIGICLGMQLLADSSEEDGLTNGLGLIRGKVVRMDGINERLPHIGFNVVKFENSNPLFNGINDQSDFYFIHSYHFISAEEKSVLGYTPYGFEFESVVRDGNIFGVQFHPEKSQSSGLKLLSNFVNPK